MNKYACGFGAGIISLLLFIVFCCACSEKGHDGSLVLIPSDTIVFPANSFGSFTEAYSPAKDQNRYKMSPAVGVGEEVIVFQPDYPDKTTSYKFHAIRELDREKYICANALKINDSVAMVNFLWEWNFYKITPDGNILDTLRIHDQRSNRDEYQVYWFMSVRRVKDDPVSGEPRQVFFSAIKHTDLTIYKSGSIEQRTAVMKGVGVGVVANITDTSVNILREIGHYPEVYFSSDKIYKSEWPRLTVNKSGKLVYIFREVDSLYVTYIQSNETMIYPLGLFESSKQSQYPSLLLSIYYDPYREFIYVVYLPPVNKTDEEGYLIDASKRPWNLIILDDAFEIVHKFSFNEAFCKHHFMVGEKGIYVRNLDLSEDNSEGMVSVLFKYENNE